MRFRIERLEQQYPGGRLLGYRITYHQRGRPDDTTVRDVDVNNTERITLENLTEGKTYVVFVSAYSSKGVGPSRTYAVACKSSTCHITFKVHDCNGLLDKN